MVYVRSAASVLTGFDISQWDNSPLVIKRILGVRLLGKRPKGGFYPDGKNCGRRRGSLDIDIRAYY